MGHSLQSPQPAADLVWPSGLLRLALLVEMCPEPLPRQSAALRHQATTLAPAELRRAFLPLAAAMLRRTAGIMAQALGCELAELLRFCDPDCAQTVLQGTRSRQYRLNQHWGGAPINVIEAETALAWSWPGPMRGHIIALGGRVEHNGRTMPRYGCAAPNPGDVVGLGADGALLMRRSPTATLLEATLAAGFSFAEMLTACSGTAPTLETAAGRFTLRPADRAVLLNGRTVRLTPGETRALEALLQGPGMARTREELIRQLRLSNPRALDRVILGLRDKLGDGLITTVYGTGYALEVRSEEGAAAAGPEAAAAAAPEG